jgi:hypothetical protein
VRELFTLRGGKATWRAPIGGSRVADALRAAAEASAAAGPSPAGSAPRGPADPSAADSPAVSFLPPRAEP